MPKQQSASKSKESKLPRREKKIKKEKDINAPKKSLTSFLYYIQRCQKDFKAANPNLVHKEAIAKMGAEWQKMSDKDKKPFNDLSAIDKARYEKEKQEYQNTLKKGAVVKKKETPVKSTVDKKTKDE